MKDKILKTEISAACERIARALRQYSNEPMTCDIFIETRDSEPIKDSDFYSMTVSFGGENVENVDIIKQGARVTYQFDRFEGEKIRKTEILFGGEESE